MYGICNYCSVLFWLPGVVIDSTKSRLLLCSIMNERIDEITQLKDENREKNTQFRWSTQSITIPYHSTILHLIGLLPYL